jgi:flagellar biogenesis protein FliO
MADRLLTALALVVLASALPAQEPEFAATAPAKVLLPIEAGSTPAPETNVPAPSDPAASMVEEQATTDAQATDPVDPEIAAIGVEMDKQAAIETAAPATSAGGLPAEPNRVSASPLKTVGKGVVALCVTLVLILLIFAAIKRWGKRTPLLAGQQLARTLGRVALSPQASLHFVQTNGEVLIIGVTQQQVTLLRSFESSDFEGAVEAPGDKGSSPAAVPAASFLTQLKESRAAMGVEAVVDEDLDHLKGELQRLKQYFQDSTRARD